MYRSAQGEHFLGEGSGGSGGLPGITKPFKGNSSNSFERDQGKTGARGGKEIFRLCGVGRWLLVNESTEGEGGYFRDTRKKTATVVNS